MAMRQCPLPRCGIHFAGVNHAIVTAVLEMMSKDSDRDVLLIFRELRHFDRIWLMAMHAASLSM